MNLLNHFKEQLNVSQADRIWSLTTISFDIMVLEVFLPLISGAKLLVCPHCISSNPVWLVNWINQHKPTIMQATPTQYSMIVDHIKPNDNMIIIVGGEAVSPNIAKRLLKVTKSVFNAYGPSETTIWSTVKKLTKADNITIGKPISNTTCIVLDSNCQVVPFGCVGELCIGGIGVSEGYYERPELNKTRFIDYDGNKFYRTGDLVKLIKMDSEYELEYIGRTDFQVKIRGHRIELGEIINVMEQYKSVKNAIVTTKENNGNTFLVAYYTGENDSNIIEYLRSKLPSYMVPNFTIWLSRFPETLNGKTDIKRLPNPFDDTQNIICARSHCEEIIAPRNNLEKELYEIFASILGHKKISVTDSILNVGGSSIMYAQFISRISRKYNIELTFEQFIKNSTIESCAKLMTGL